MALAEMVGRDGRVYAVDSDPAARDEVARAAAAHAQVIALTQAGEDLSLPEEVDLAFCRFLLLHVIEPEAVVRMMAAAVRPGGWVVAQEPITSAGRVAGSALSMPDAAPPRRRRAAAGPGARRRTRGRRRLGRGPGRRRARARHALPGVAHRASIPGTTRWSFPRS